MKITKKILKELLLGIVFTALAVATVALFWKNNVAVTIVLFFESAAAIYLWREKEDIAAFGAGFVIGPITEIISIMAGAWTYTNPLVLGIPTWLPFLWGLGVLIAKRMAQTFFGKH